MDSNNDFTPEISNDDLQSLASIYRQISVEFNDSYDELSENNLLYDIIDKCFTTEFKRIDNKILINDVTLFNGKLVELIKKCKTERYKKINIIFITFCDYFDLPYNVMFLKLHPKIKESVLNKYVDLVGIEEYQKQKQKYEVPKDYTQLTLFELLKNEQ